MPTHSHCSQCQSREALSYEQTPPLRPLKMAYGVGALSQLVRRFRLWLNLRTGNVAVFEFEKMPLSFKKMIDKPNSCVLRIVGNRLIVANVGNVEHSEWMADQLIQKAKRMNMALNVTRIYSEYSPCARTCSPIIRRNYPQAQVSFSFSWDGKNKRQEQNAKESAIAELFRTAPSSKIGLQKRPNGKPCY